MTEEIPQISKEEIPIHPYDKLEGNTYFSHEMMMHPMLNQFKHRMPAAISDHRRRWVPVQGSLRLRLDVEPVKPEEGIQPQMLHGVVFKVAKEQVGVFNAAAMVHRVSSDPVEIYLADGGPVPVQGSLMRTNPKVKEDKVTPEHYIALDDIFRCVVSMQQVVGREGLQHFVQTTAGWIPNIQDGEERESTVDIGQMPEQFGEMAAAFVKAELDRLQG